MDKLFLLDPAALMKNGFPRFCPDCAMVKGYLTYYPQVEQTLEIEVLSPERPRPAIIELLGEENQGAPVLILDRDSSIPGEDLEVKIHGDRRFIDKANDILTYLGKKYGGGLSLDY